MIDSPQSPQKSQQGYDQQGTSTTAPKGHDSTFWVYTLIEGILLYLFKGLCLAYFSVMMVPLFIAMPTNLEISGGTILGITVGLVVGMGFVSLFLDQAADGLALIPFAFRILSQNIIKRTIRYVEVSNESRLVRQGEQARTSGRL